MKSRKTHRNKLTEKLKKIKVLILDVDGILTDGRLFFSDNGVEMKSFHVRDGHGIVMLKKAGISTIFISGRESSAVAHRARELGVKKVYQNVYDKLSLMNRIASRSGLSRENIAYMGDDITDLPMLRNVGFSATVKNAAEEVKSEVDYITSKKGGNGGVREVAELMLRAQNKWDKILKGYT